MRFRVRSQDTGQAVLVSPERCGALLRQEKDEAGSRPRVRGRHSLNAFIPRLAGDEGVCVLRLVFVLIRINPKLIRIEVEDEEEHEDEFSPALVSRNQTRRVFAANQMEDQHMKTVRSFALALAGAVLTLNSPSCAAVLQEDFSSDPLQRGWQALGDIRLFAWDAAGGKLQVTWDSRQTNSYFCRPLGTVLSQDDNFSVAFDLSLSDFTPGIDPLKNNSPFQIAVALIRKADAIAPQFIRGSGTASPNIVEFDFFPDPGGAWQWGPSLTVSVCDRTGFNWSSGGFAPAGLTTNDVFRVELVYDAAVRALNTTLLRNGTAFLTMPPAVLGTNFTDLRVDTLALCSYNDAGQWPGYEGSILAHGTVDNFTLTLPPPPVEHIACGPASAPGQVWFVSRTNWLYALERTTDFATWAPASASLAGHGGLMTLQDTNPPPAGCFYRVQAQRP